MIDLFLTSELSLRFYLPLYFSVPGVFFFLRNRLKKLVPPLVASILGKFEQILWE